MSEHKSSKKREPGEQVYPEPRPKVELLKPPSECSTPELASELSEGVKTVLRRLGRKREAGADDNAPKAKARTGSKVGSKKGGKR